MALTNEKVYEYLKKASVIVLAISFLLLLISFGAPYWGRTNHLVKRKDYIGLWRFCADALQPGGKYAQKCDDYINIVTHDWQRATQALMILAMFAALPTLGVFAAFCFSPNFQLNLKMFGACCATALTTVFFIGVACAVWAANYEDWFGKFDPAFRPEVASLGWAFYMAAVVAVMHVLAIGMIIPDTYYALREETMPSKPISHPYNL